MQAQPSRSRSWVTSWTPKGCVQRIIQATKHFSFLVDADPYIRKYIYLDRTKYYRLRTRQPPDYTRKWSFGLAWRRPFDYLRRWPAAYTRRQSSGYTRRQQWVYCFVIYEFFASIVALFNCIQLVVVRDNRSIGSIRRWFTRQSLCIRIWYDGV